MNGPDADRLARMIRKERPELIVDAYPRGGVEGRDTLRVYCIKREGRELVRESVDTLYGPDGWQRYLEKHPQRWCRPEESFRTDALGRELDHHGRPVASHIIPAAPLTAEQMLARIIGWNKQDQDWWR